MLGTLWEHHPTVRPMSMARGTGHSAPDHELDMCPDVQRAGVCLGPPRALQQRQRGPCDCCQRAGPDRSRGARRRARARHARPAGPAGRRAQSTRSAR